jgi:hypothetical protein
MEDGRRRLAYVNGGLQERPGFNGSHLTFKHQRRRPMVGAGVHGSRRAKGGDDTARAAPTETNCFLFFFERNNSRADDSDFFSFERKDSAGAGR